MTPFAAFSGVVCAAQLGTGGEGMEGGGTNMDERTTSRYDSVDDNTKSAVGTGVGAAAGAAAGAVIGTIVPGVGNAVGAVIGGARRLAEAL